MTKTFYRNNYIDIDLYWKGCLIGFGIEDDIITICIPFIILHIKMWAFNRKPKPSKF